MREWITGRNAVCEVILTRRREVFELQLAQGIQITGRMPEILQIAKDRKIKTSYIPRKNLDKRFGEKHQGLALETSRYSYSSVDEMIALSKERQEPLFILLLDVLKNPQNFGTLIRTAEAVGVHGVIFPRARTAEINATVVNASSGATEHLLIAQSNLSQAISQLKEAGAWIAGLEGGSGSQPISQVKLTGPLGIVVGSEGAGMRALTRKECDFIVSLPMHGKIESLNAAVAGSVMLYFVLQARQT
ncbi:MAG: 23S rRNA (guanosine(2251)-2'-O)-methyltransferase RlmB [Anaerolineaceae bacterium]|nr:23S rRNA (guanosine(2251)-2'-O)-methyltransferase RlmB [Anaerolineaceae bacterium]